LNAGNMSGAKPNRKASMIECVSGVVGGSGSGVYIDFTPRGSLPPAPSKGIEGIPGQSRTGIR
jgi:hypothetical protein